MLIKIGKYQITNGVIYINDTDKLILRTRKTINKKKPRNYLNINQYSRMFSSIYPVDKVENWQYMTLEELNKAGIYDFMLDYENIIYFIKVDILAGTIEFKESRKQLRLA